MKRTVHALAAASANVAVAVMLAAGSAAQAQGIDKLAAADAVVSPESMTCTHSFTASNLSWCLSANGNLVSLKSRGVEQIRFGGVNAIEGYGLCVGNVLKAWDNAFAGAGFGAPAIIVAKTATGITIRRKTTDGKWQLDQKWSRDNTERDLTVQMTLKNLGSAASNVKLWRFADINVDFGMTGSYGNRYDQGWYALWFVDPGYSAVTMSSLWVTNASIDLGFTSFSAGQPSCSPGWLGVPGGPTDVMGHLGYGFSSIASAAQKVVKVVYRVY